MPGRQRVLLSEYEARRIAIVKPSALGDIVHCLPVLSALRRRFPSAFIGWVVNAGYESLLQGHPHLDMTLPFPRSAWRHGKWQAIRAYASFARKLRAQRFDLVIDVQGLLRSGLMCALSGSARRVGLSTAREGAAWTYTDVVRVADYNALHAVDRYLLLAEALGAGDAPKEFILPVDARAESWAANILSTYPRPFMAFGVGARWLTKRWPPGHFAELARRALKQAGGTIVLIGGADERDLAADAAKGIAGPVLDLTGRTTLPQLTAILRKADVLVANDTGPLHLAVALGRPVVAPYTCTKPSLCGPYGRPDQAAETTVWCRGSYLRNCDRLECMNELTPDRLWPILQGILARWQSSSRVA